jgi:hypothetical protein
VIAAYIKHIYTTHSSAIEIHNSPITELPPIPFNVTQLVLKACPNITALPYAVLARVELLSDNAALHQNISQGFKDTLKYAEAYADPTVQQLIFDRNLLTMLEIYSKVVDSLITISVTRDIANHVSPKTIESHRLQWYKILGGRHFSEPDSIRLAIQHAIANCDHMACIGKSMLDLYLADSLQQLGYRNVDIQTFVMTGRPPARHYVIMTKCSWNGAPPKIGMVDAWSAAAWRYAHGLDQLRARTPDRYTHPNIMFEYRHDIDFRLEHPSSHALLQQCFAEHNIKEKIDAAIKANESRFIPWVKATGKYLQTPS